METELVLRTDALCKSYKGLRVVDHVNMNVHKGDIYGFVGENGAGKTTILRLVSGLAIPDSGTYSLFGVERKDLASANIFGKVGGIIEIPSIYRSFSALENLKMQCVLTGISKTDEELTEILERVGLDVKAIGKKKAGSFSLGMRQRLGIAMSLASDPELLLLDEPMNGLDPQGFHDMRELILKLHEQGVTFIISSHILSELEKIATRVGFISHGNLLEEITMAELREKSRKRIVISAKDLAAIEELLKAKLKLKEFKVENDLLYLYDEIDVDDVMKLLVDNKLRVDTISVNEESMEDYYRHLIGGGQGK